MADLRTYRQQGGISQRQLAARLGVDQSVISRIEKGPGRPSLDLAIKIERATKGAVPVASWVKDDAHASSGGPVNQARQLTEKTGNVDCNRKASA